MTGNYEAEVNLSVHHLSIISWRNGPLGCDDLSNALFVGSDCLKF